MAAPERDPTACVDADVASGYVEGWLDGAARSAIDAHLDLCSRCRRHVSELAQLAVPSADERAEPGDAPDAPLQAGTKVGRYLIEGPLGAGGMGVVYAARDPELGRMVALKRVRADIVESEAAHNRLLREARAMALLSHPNVIAVYDLVLHDRRLFVAMERIDGTDVRTWWSSEKPGWRSVLAAFVQAGRGLAAAHAMGLVHRDFKPANVLRDRNGRVAVADFGLVRFADAENEFGPAEAGASHPADATASGAVLGTPAYMAPEQRAGGAADARSDQFAFAVALYEGLFGEHPFTDGARVAEEAVMSGRVREAPSGSNVPTWIRKVVLRGLRTDPRERHPSLDAMLAALTKDPSETRRRLFALGVAIACALGIAAASYGNRRAAASLVCTGAERKLAGVWDAETKQAVASMFRANGKPYAEDAWRGAERALDTYTLDWVMMHTEACEATRVRGEQSEELLDRRMACLADRLKEARALTRVFARADDTTVRNADQAVRELTSLALCADGKALLSLRKPPPSGAGSEKVDALRDELTEVEALRRAGHYKDVLPRATAAVEMAEGLGARAEVAVATLLTGDLMRRTGDLKNADRMLRRALVAADATGNDRTRVRAVGQLLMTDGFDDNASVEVIASLRDQGLAAIDRLGGDDEAEGEFFHYLGLALFSQKRLHDARSAVQAALQRNTRVWGRDHRHVAANLVALAMIDGEEGEYDVALARFERALEIQRQSLGNSHPDIAITHANIGNLILVTQLTFARAADEFRTALTIAEAALGPDHVTVGLFAGNLGETLAEDGQYASALPHLERALRLHEANRRPDHPHLAWCLWLLGNAHLGLNQPRVALPYLERALSIPGEPLDGASARFALARALTVTRGDPTRARRLAVEARDEYAKSATTTLDKKRLRDIEGWLAQHPGR